MIFVEPIPEPKNKGFSIEPNLTRRIQQRENLMLAKRNAAALLMSKNNCDLKEVSEIPEPRQKSASFIKRRTNSWHEVKKVFNPLPLQFMPMLRSTSK